MSGTIIVLLIIAVIVASIILNAMNNAYKETGKKEDKITLGKVIIWFIIAIIFVFGCFFNLLGSCGHDTSEILFGR